MYPQWCTTHLSRVQRGEFLHSVCLVSQVLSATNQAMRAGANMVARFALNVTVASGMNAAAARPKPQAGSGPRRRPDRKSVRPANLRRQAQDSGEAGECRGIVGGVNSVYLKGIVR
jgi:hypothetical protein